MIGKCVRMTPRFALLQADPKNKECADCCARDPRWASWNLGLFLCARCNGEHRNLGTHISRTRSLDLDDWTEEHLEAMEVVGNTNGDAYWCYNVPFGRSKPLADDYPALLREWIECKYTRKEFLKRGAMDALDMPTVQSYEREGWLSKEGGGTGKGKYQQRYFVLKDFALNYYKEKPEPSSKSKNVAKGSIPIQPKTSIVCAADHSGPQVLRFSSHFVGSASA